MRCTPTICATLAGPPSFLMTEVAGSIDGERSYNRYEVKRGHSELANRRSAERTLRFWMIDEWLVSAIKSSGISQADLGREMTAGLCRSVDAAAVNKMANGKRKIKADEMLEIARITGFPLPEHTAKGKPIPTSGKSSGQIPRERVLAAIEVALSVVMKDEPSKARALSHIVLSIAENPPSSTPNIDILDRIRIGVEAQARPILDERSQ